MSAELLDYDMLPSRFLQMGVTFNSLSLTLPQISYLSINYCNWLENRLSFAKNNYLFFSYSMSPSTDGFLFALLFLGIE
jgi:hypothetical protein